MSKAQVQGTSFHARLRQARLRADLSQKQLGIKAGIDEFVASTRINRYEKGKYQPDIDTAERLAAVLEVPVAYLFTKDDRLAELILTYFRLPKRKQDALFRAFLDETH